LLLPLLSFIGNLYSFPLISPMGILYYQGLDIMLTIVGQCHVQRFMTLPKQTMTSALKVSKYIITSITARPIGFPLILEFMSFSTFITDIFLYSLRRV
jgi:hypothetical protein